MSDSYTFRYSQVDGSFGGVIVMDCKDQQAAERDAARLMPTCAASFEIWRSGKLLCELGSSKESEQESLSR
jgi:hypothetical protein